MKECNDRYLMQRRYGRFFANGNMRDVVAVITCARGDYHGPHHHAYNPQCSRVIMIHRNRFRCSVALLDR